MVTGLTIFCAVLIPSLATENVTRMGARKFIDVSGIPPRSQNRDLGHPVWCCITDVSRSGAESL